MIADSGASDGESPRVPSAFAAFAAAQPFALARYQREALAAMDEPGTSIVLVAPTGSGKSLVADAAVWSALQNGELVAGRGVVYTSPLKALANQRFDQISARWGVKAGLLTGDTALRPEAPARVMTAEVYRSIALAAAGENDAASGGSASRMRDLRWAIFDEAHYLADPDRGSVWEEAILATPRETRILCLSATVGAPERLVAWLEWLGRSVRLIHVAERPVPLRHYLSVRGDLHLVLDEHGERAERFPFAGGWALAQRRRSPHRGGAGPLRRRRDAPLAGLPAVAPDDWIRDEAIEALRRLRERALTPTIAFVSARREAERLAAAAAATFPEDAAGVAFHHAGMPPEARRAVERRLRAGQLWLVCGTTTLAAGIDVPARSVLLTSFGRFDGRNFSLFTAAEYRQLSGRGGRLGKDDAGAAILLASPWHSFEEAFRLLTAPLPPLESAFQPTYATALAWWSAGPASQSLDERTQRLARMLSSTFAAYLRRARGATAPRRETADDASLHEARAIGRLLVADDLIDEEGRVTARGAFVRRIGGGAEGRLLLRLDEARAFDELEEADRFRLLALIADGALDNQPAQDTAARGRYRAALAAQVALERQVGALLTPAPRPPRRGDEDTWRQRQEVADLLERTLRAAAASNVPLSMASWARRFLGGRGGDLDRPVLE